MVGGKAMIMTVMEAPKTIADQSSISPLRREILDANRVSWKPGQSGNPKGRPKAGAVIAEWYDQLAGCEREELEKIRDNPRTPVAKRAAAIEWLNASSEDRTAAGMPINGVSADRISDRTSGKPQSNANINHTGTVGHIHLDAAAIARLPPEKLAQIQEVMAFIGLMGEATAETEPAKMIDVIPEPTPDIQCIETGKECMTASAEMEKGQTADQPIPSPQSILEQPTTPGDRETGIQ